MSLLGVLARNANPLGDLPIAGQDPVDVLAFPQTNPYVAVVVARDPALETARLPDDSFAVVDGAIYNIAELQAAVGAGPRPAAHAASTVLHLFKVEGARSMARVNGDAAIAIWDAADEALFLFRSRGGTPPMFYAEHAGRVVWSTSLRTLLAAGVPRAVDMHALDIYLACGYVPAPWTFVQAIRKLPPAHYAAVGHGRLSIDRYWSPTWRPKHRLPPEEVTRHLGVLFRAAVRRRLPDQGPTGLLLSGGVDSALAAAALVEAAPGPVHAFTFRYTHYEGPDNEGGPARAVASHLGVPHHEILFGPSDVAGNLERFLEAYEEPFSYGLHSAILHPVRQQGIHILFSGTGPICYEVGSTQDLALRLEWVPDILRQSARLALWLPKRRSRWLRALHGALVLSGQPVGARYYTASITSARLRSVLYRNPSHGTSGTAAALRLFEATQAAAGGASRDRLTHLHMAFTSAERSSWWFHRWGRHHGLSIRKVYWDNDLVDFYTRLERRYADKADVRRLAATMLPHAMAYAPKYYQTIPLNVWFRGPLRNLLTERLTPAQLERAGLFDAATVGRLIERHVAGTADHTWTLWGLLAFTVWKDVVLDRPLPPEVVTP